MVYINCQEQRTPASSKQNLSQWVDVAKYCKDALVHDMDGNTEPGHLEYLKLNEFFELMQAIQRCLRSWGNNCISQGLSYGKCYCVAGSGRGSVSMT